MTNILLAHGSPDARHGDQVRQLAGKVSALLDDEVRVSFLSDESMPAGARVLPLFLGVGQHLRLDVPKLVRASGCQLLPPLASHADTLATMAMDLATRESRRLNVLLAIYRFFGFEELVAALYGQSGRCAKLAMASMHGEPSIGAVLRHWRDEGIVKITMQSVLLFDGFTCDKARATADRVAGLELSFGPPLAEHEGMPSFIADCLKGSAK